MQTKLTASLSGWRSRGYLPHFDGGEVPQSITFRLADSLPQAKLREWQHYLNAVNPQRVSTERRRLVESYLDKGLGSAVLQHPAVANLVQQALLWFDAEKYKLHAWVIMPNHVHVLITPNEGYSLAEITHSWKSVTAKQINVLLGKTGTLWQRESFERAIRNEIHFRDSIYYIEYNPVKAGLCVKPHLWLFGSARHGDGYGVWDD